MMLSQKPIVRDDTQIMPRALDDTRPMPAAGFLRQANPAGRSRISKKMAALFLCAFFAAAAFGFYSAQYARERIELAENAWAYNRRAVLAFGDAVAEPMRAIQKARVGAEQSKNDLETAVQSAKAVRDRSRVFLAEQFVKIETARRFLYEKKMALLAFFQRKESARQ